jgi:hypothetical protein
MNPASWMNDQSKYMVPNWPDQEKKKAANLYDNHQFIGVDSSHYGNHHHHHGVIIDHRGMMIRLQSSYTNWLNQNDGFHRVFCMDNSNDLLFSMISS